MKSTHQRICTIPAQKLTVADRKRCEEGEGREALGSHLGVERETSPLAKRARIEKERGREGRDSSSVIGHRDVLAFMAIGRRRCW